MSTVSVLDTLPAIAEHPEVADRHHRHSKAQGDLSTIEKRLAEIELLLAPPKHNRDGTPWCGESATAIERSRLVPRILAYFRGEDLSDVPLPESLRDEREKLLRARSQIVVPAIRGVSIPDAEPYLGTERELAEAQSRANKAAAETVRAEYRAHVRRCVNAAIELRSSLLATETFMSSIESKGYGSVFSSWLRSVRGRWHVSLSDGSPDDFVLFKREMTEYGLYSPK